MKLKSLIFYFNNIQLKKNLNSKREREGEKEKL